MPLNLFNRIERYSIRFLKLCDECNISSNAHRDLVNFVNEMLTDTTLRKFHSQYYY